MVTLRNRLFISILAGASITLVHVRCPGGETQPAREPVAVFTRHADPVIALTFTASGTRVVSVSPVDIQTWDAATGENAVGIKVPGEQIGAVAPDGTSVAFTSTERVGQPVIVRSVADGKEMVTFRPHADVTERTAFGSFIGALTFSPDGKRLATAGRSGLVGGPHGLPGGVVTLWDSQTGKPLLHIRGPRPGVSTSAFAGAIAFSGDGAYLAAGTDGAGGELPESGEVIVWDTTHGKVVRAIQVRDEVKPGDFHSAVTSVALSHNGQWVAAAFGNRPGRADGLLLSDQPTTTLRMYEVATGRVVHSLTGHQRAIGQLAFSRDGKRLASAGSDAVVRVWNTATGEQVQTLAFDAAPVRALGFSPDRKYIAAGGGKNKAGIVRVWSCPGD